MTESFGAIWNTLSSVPIDHLVIEKPGKGNPSYLSWGDAWGLLMQHYPSAAFVFHRSDKRYDGDEVFEALDGSAEVRCTVIIDGCRRDMWLPVMDHKFDAVFEPNARDVSDAKMRCLVKCLAMFGLGHKLYAKAKEDIPSEDKRSGPVKRPERKAPPRPQRPQRTTPGQFVDIAEKTLDALNSASTLADLEDAYDAGIAEAKRYGIQTLLDDLPGHFERIKTERF